MLARPRYSFFFLFGLDPKNLLLWVLLKICTFQLKKSRRKSREKKTHLNAAMQQMSKPPLLDFAWCDFIKVPKSAGIHRISGFSGSGPIEEVHMKRLRPLRGAAGLPGCWDRGYTVSFGTESRFCSLEFFFFFARFDRLLKRIKNAADVLCYRCFHVGLLCLKKTHESAECNIKNHFSFSSWN